MPYANKEERAAYHKQYSIVWREKNKEKIAAKNKEDRLKHKTNKCLSCDKMIMWTSTYCITCHNKNQLVNEGFTAERNRFNNSAEWANVRLECFIRDEYTCQHCFKRGVILNAHHIDFYKNAPNKRLDIQNLMTLCRPCHENLHWGKNETD